MHTVELTTDLNKAYLMAEQDLAFGVAIFAKSCQANPEAWSPCTDLIVNGDDEMDHGYAPTLRAKDGSAPIIRYILDPEHS